MTSDGVTARSRLAAVARGEKPADLYIRDGTILNVYSGELVRANIAIQGERIAYVGNREDMVGASTDILSAAGQILCPGYVEPHAHPWALFNPLTLAEASLVRGITTVFADDLQLFDLGGPQGFFTFVDALDELPLKYYWIVRAYSQSRTLEEEIHYDIKIIERLLRHGSVKALGELTRWFDVYRGEPEVLKRIELALHLGKRVEGHSAGASYEKLNGLAAAGVASCHESINSQEVLDRLRLGFAVMLRYSSHRPDLPQLLGPLAEAGISSPRLMLTNDGPSPAFVVRHGLLDGAVKIAMEKGFNPIESYRMATINPATYFGMDHEIGGIAPGRYGDVLLLNDLAEPQPAVVIARGKVVAREGSLLAKLPEVAWEKVFPLERLVLGSWQAKASDFLGPEESISLPSMRLESAVITRLEGSMVCRGGRAGFSDVDDASLACLIARDGSWTVRAVLRGVGPGLDAVATTFTNAWQILVLGRDLSAMAQALNRLASLRGGIVVMGQGKTLFEMPLPLAGTMSLEGEKILAAQAEHLTDVFKACGYRFEDPLFTLCFLSADFLPEVRLTPMGVWRVKDGQVLARPTPRAALKS